MQKAFSKFISSGFGDINANNSRHIIGMYRNNYHRHLPENKQARILEIGCGLGRFLEFLAEEGYQNYLGIDISQEAIDYCHEKGINKTELINDLPTYLIACPMYDCIVLNDVIEHLEKDKIIEILEKIGQKLSVGGVLIVKTGNLASLVGARIRFNDFTHTCGFTEYSLTQALKIANFNDIMIYPFRFPRNRLTRALRAIGTAFVHGLWKLIYFFEYTIIPKYVDEIIFAVVKK